MSSFVPEPGLPCPGSLSWRSQSPPQGDTARRGTKTRACKAACAILPALAQRPCPQADRWVCLACAPSTQWNHLPGIRLNWQTAPDSQAQGAWPPKQRSWGLGWPFSLHLTFSRSLQVETLGWTQVMPTEPLKGPLPRVIGKDPQHHSGQGPDPAPPQWPLHSRRKPSEQHGADQRSLYKYL